MALKLVKENSGIFLSYYQGSEKSREIVEQLYEFFEKKWQIKCYVFEMKKTSDAPDYSMFEDMSKSRYFLQLFTDHNNTRKFMQQEFNMARTLLHSNSTMKKLVILHTNETDLKHRSFKVLESLRDDLRIRTCNLDKLKEVENLLCGILIDTGQLGSDVQDGIKLPAFCQPTAIERMTWEVVEEFIRNFRGASMKGLERFYADREELIPDLKRRLERLRHEKGLVRMIGFTLKGYLLPTRRGDVGSLFKSAIDNGANAELLLLRPDCDAARERWKIETPDAKVLEDSLFCRDSRAVTSYYEGKPRIKIQYYNTPYVGLILFEDQAYVEIYHLGKQDPDMGICGRVPILGVKRRDEPGLYQLFERHFNSVWRPDEIKPSISEPVASPGLAIRSASKDRRTGLKKTVRVQGRS